ncbi:kelch repeat-containing protein [Planctomycetes bacterium K23_9]|uniref:N-acetylneuraminate epimerase n=1 Tax=Stieleria marina TaxID=1930275 RepID=A0A517NPC1_9BACT|nr:N-acetylneuraminate epimerase precursor [Planctomycetes bacterium K23_9]
MRCFVNRMLSVCSLFLIATPVIAHFPWMAIGEDGKALYYFGETPADRTYKLPPSILKAKANCITDKGGVSALSLTPLEQKDFVGMHSEQLVPTTAILTSQVTYGVYHGTRLEYFTQHCGGKLPTRSEESAELAKKLDLHAVLTDTDSGVDVAVVWKGKPLADTDVTLYGQEGHEVGKVKTNESGKVSFTDAQVEEGLNGILVGHTVSGQTGTLGDQTYESVSHYLTATFVDPEDFEAKKADAAMKPASDPQSPSILVDAERFPAIPQGVTSFGAAVTGDALFVYGGHSGGAHSYYAEAQGKELWKLDLKNPKSWKSLGEGPGAKGPGQKGAGLQGLAMVTHGGKLYRIGGFNAKNSEGEDKDLWSQDSVARYDPATNQWESLPPLPEPRSSFDAAVLGDKIYVVGGWSMQGDSDSQWLDTAHVLDLSAPTLKWKALAKPPFVRRALSVAAHNGKIYAIGGMQSEGGPSKRTDVYDPQTNTWSQGPELIGEPMDGFGSSSFATGGKLYATTYSGFLQSLSADGKSWQKLAELDSDRFFHRLLPLSSNQLLVVGGASMSSGKFEEVEVITIP